VIRVLGVDGGQSGIRLRHSDGPAIVERPGVSRNEGDVVAAVAATIATGWRESGFAPIDRAVLGLTTAPVDPDDADRLSALVASATGAREVWLADDAVTGHAGALGLGSGVSLIAGTGVACLALPRDGAPRLIGGHGYLLGDEGGAFWLGRRALARVLRAREGRGDAAPLERLTTAASARFGDLDELPARLHAQDRPVHEVAAFAPDVLAAARDGDAAAERLLDEAVDELRATVLAGARWAADRSTAPVPVALGGRLLGVDSPLRRRLEARLTSAEDGEPGIALREAVGSGLDGALAIGRGDVGHRYGGLVREWHAGVPA
jgi:N-acetylglucosamine kinase-like BadF-type ATPase